MKGSHTIPTRFLSICIIPRLLLAKPAVRLPSGSDCNRREIGLVFRTIGVTACIYFISTDPLILRSPDLSVGLPDMQRLPFLIDETGYSDSSDFPRHMVQNGLKDTIDGYLRIANMPLTLNCESGYSSMFRLGTVRV